MVLIVIFAGLSRGEDVPSNSNCEDGMIKTPMIENNFVDSTDGQLHLSFKYDPTDAV